VIEARNIEFHYAGGDFSLQVPEVDVGDGATVAMIGPSGTGKTTLLNIMAGFYLPHRGSMRVMGKDLSGMSDGARRHFRIQNIGLVFQEFELLGYLSVLDNVLLPYRITGGLDLDRVVRDRAEALASDVGLGNKLRRNVNRLSQGERQRVAVCRALLPKPKLLLCDEPTGNLDPANKNHVLDILFNYVSLHGTALVVVTHDHDLLTRFDRTIDFRRFGTQS